jgi:hypothetical protein
MTPTPFSASYWGDASSDGQRLPFADDVEFVLEVPERLAGKAAEIFPRLKDEGFREIFSKDGVVLLQRVNEGGPSSTQGPTEYPAVPATIAP